MKPCVHTLLRIKGAYQGGHVGGMVKVVGWETEGSGFKPGMLHLVSELVSVLWSQRSHAEGLTHKEVE